MRSDPTDVLFEGPLDGWSSGCDLLRWCTSNGQEISLILCQLRGLGSHPCSRVCLSTLNCG